MKTLTFLALLSVAITAPAFAQAPVAGSGTIAPPAPAAPTGVSVR